MTNFGGVLGENLRQIVSKLEKAIEEKKEAAEFVSDTYKEAKAMGFDKKVLQLLIKIRAADQSKLAEMDEILDMYKHAMGMVESDAG